jgi:gliding motility-associated-like protein
MFLNLPKLCKMYKIILFLLLASTSLFSQKQANHWYFGDGAGLDFNASPPSILLNGQTDFLSPIGWNESYSSISDSSGALLFYSDGVRVWNKIQNIMLNGNNLLGHRSSSMGCLIVPKPGSSRFFYIFTNDALENNFQNGLRYSIVDICGDNSKGEVISTAKNVPLYSLTSERLVSVKHSNGLDYWIISHKFNSNEFCAFLLTNAGIVDTVISNTGPIDVEGWGEMAISNNGKKISYCMPTNNSSITSAFIADFNILTGGVTNVQILSMGEREYATSFSPDNSKIYFSTAGVGNLFQYDLNSPNLTTLISSKSFLFQNSPDQWRHMAHGPDGNIYISRTGKNYLSAIYNPNNLYPGCTYVDSSIYLGSKFTSHGLPNFIADFQYMNTIMVCYHYDSIIKSICQGSSYLGYNTTGIHIDTLLSSNGCDSIRTLNLTVLPNSSINLTQVICQGNSYLGYNSSGIYIDTLLSSNGCDSIRTLNLTVLSNSSSNITQAICQGNSYSGYNTTGTYIDTLLNANGCDSIRTLNLTVLSNSSENITQTICQGSSYLGYNTSGTYIDTLLNANGCDSIRTLNLKIVPKLYDTIRHKLCPGEKYFPYNQPGVYIDTFINSLGCDSIRIFKLELDENLCCKIFLPNAFTPNGDNLNDEFIIKDIFDDYNLLIADRWGNIVFRSSNSFIGWDGKYKGIEMPIGTYFYLLKYKCNNSDMKMVKGDITLIR